MREEIEEAKKEKNRACHRNYSREYRARNLENRRKQLVQEQKAQERKGNGAYALPLLLKKIMLPA